MLGPGRYLLGTAELALLIGFAWLGASALRSRLVPSLSGAPAQLASAVLALALLILSAELPGSFGALEPLPYLLTVALAGLALRALARGRHQGRCRERKPRLQAPPLMVAAGQGSSATTFVSLAIAAIAVIHFATGVRLRLSTGMTGFDSTWYHAPFAAGFFQSGNTIDLHFIAPQFLAWFYPANGEIFHAVGMLAFGRDLLSPLLNLGWFVGSLIACWCIGRPYRVAPWSLSLGAVALSVPALADQAGEARNDIVGIFFLLAAIAIALNTWAVRREGESSLSAGALALVGLTAGLAAGTKLNFLLPAVVLVVGLVVLAPRGGRLRAFAAVGLAALAGGGYWYLRNLIHSGNPLPWVHHLGPISLPAPQQALGGREAHSVIGYLGDGVVWSDWLLPGLHSGLWIVWPLLAAAALAGLLLCLDLRSHRFRGSESTKEVDMEPRNRGRRFRGSESTDEVGKEPRNGRGADRELVLALAGLVGLATALAWLVAPTSASGPDGMPRGFESGLRYLTPALVLGLALLPTAPSLRDRLARLGGPGSQARSRFYTHSGPNLDRAHRPRRPAAVALLLGLILLAVAVGYPVQRHYLQSRYANPTFTTPGLNAAFKWADGITDSRIATTSTRQYPLFGTDLSNHVQFIGTETAHGGFEPPTTCPAWRTELNEGDYDYVVTTRDRLEPGKPAYPEQSRWTEGPQAKPIIRKPPTVVFHLTGTLDPSTCPN